MVTMKTPLAPDTGHLERRNAELRDGDRLDMSVEVAKSSDSNLYIGVNANVSWTAVPGLVSACRNPDVSV